MTTNALEPRSRGSRANRPPSFVRCTTCGRYIAPSERVDHRYCSTACAEKFHRCSTCGRYYAVTEAYSEEHCSRECATRYSLQRHYGPAQIDIRMEELV